MPQTSRRWTWTLLPVLAAAACDPAPPSPPDVVIIAVESLRADHLSHLGYEPPTATGLDAFRRDATLFSRAWAPTSASLASSASLLTGLAPEEHGVSGAQTRLADELITLAERLTEAGFVATGVSHHFGLSRAAGFAQGFERFETAPGPLDAYPDAGDMLAWLREWLARGPPSPAFLYLHPMNVHAPYRVPPTRRATLLGRPPGGSFDPSGDVVRAVMTGRINLRRLVTPPMRRSLVEQYDTAVRYTLERVGEMLELLQHAGRYENALIIVLGNHGEELFDHGGFGHGFTLHAEGLHVPLYLKLPGPGGGGGTLDAPVSTLDVVPTVLDVLGLPAPAGAGHSLVPVLRDPSAADPERPLLARLDEPRKRALERSLLRGRHRLVETRRRYDLPQGADLALYDHVLDPTEQSDRSLDAPEIAARLREELERRPFAGE